MAELCKDWWDHWWDPDAYGSGDRSIVVNAVVSTIRIAVKNTLELAQACHLSSWSQE